MKLSRPDPTSVGFVLFSLSKSGSEFFDSLDYYYSSRVLKPLKKFELVESRLVGEGEFYEKDEEYRKTSFYDRFIEFDL